MMASKTVKDKSRVLVISGSTAVGKTELSLHLAQRLNGEIISADSAQVYQGMDIGTAKLSPGSTQVPHHLLSIVPVTHSYAAGEFRKDTLKAIESILLRGRIPIVVGGTGFYLNTLLSNEATAPASTAEDKHYVEQLIANKTWDQRHRNPFHWVNVAPGNHRLPVEVLADHIVKWYLYDDPLPAEIDGDSLKQLTKEEQKELYKYKTVGSFTSSDIDTILSKVQHDVTPIASQNK